MAEQQAIENKKLDKAETGDSSQSVGEKMMPTLEDRQLFQSKQDSQYVDRCEADFFKNPITQDYQPTDKRKEYWKQANDALNEPDKQIEKPNAQEMELATEATRELLKLRSLDSLDSLSEYDKQREAVQKMFRELEPESIDRVLGEINRQLDGTEYKVAEAQSGEIWLGKKFDDGSKYGISTLLKEAPGCLLS